MISNLISNWTSSAFGQVLRQPWEVTSQASLLVASALESLSDEYIFKGDVAIHRTAIVEAGSSVKGPAIVGPSVFVGAGALLQGGVFLDKGCIVGRSCEVKSSIMFEDPKIAQLSFVGDSIIIGPRPPSISESDSDQPHGLPMSSDSQSTERLLFAETRGYLIVSRALGARLPFQRLAL